MNGEKDIKTSKISNYFKVSIDDYYTLDDYKAKMKSNDMYNLSGLIRNCILWNSKLQLVNKGNIYIFVVNNKLYNVLINDSKIKIDEVTKKESTEEERLLSFEQGSEDYYYFNVVKAKNKGTFSTKYYNKVRVDLGKLNYTDEEALNEITNIFNNLSQFENLKNIIDVDYIKQKVLGDITEKSHSKHY